MSDYDDGFDDGDDEAYGGPDPDTEDEDYEVEDAAAPPPPPPMMGGAPAPPPPPRSGGEGAGKYAGIVSKLSAKIKEQPVEEQDEYDYDIEPENDVTPDLPDPPTSDEEFGAPEAPPPVAPDSGRKKKREVGEKEVAGTMVQYFSNYSPQVLANFFGNLYFLVCNMQLFMTLFLLLCASLGMSIFILVYVTFWRDHYYSKSSFTLVAFIFMLMAMIPLFIAFVCGFLQVFFAFVRLHFIVPPFSQMYVLSISCYLCCICIVQFTMCVGTIVWFAAYHADVGPIINGVFSVIFMVNVCLLTCCFVCPCCCSSVCCGQGTSQANLAIQIFKSTDVVKMDLEERQVDAL